MDRLGSSLILGEPWLIGQAEFQCQNSMILSQGMKWERFDVLFYNDNEFTEGKPLDSFIVKRNRCSFMLLIFILRLNSNKFPKRTGVSVGMFANEVLLFANEDLIREINKRPDWLLAFDLSYEDFIDVTALGRLDSKSVVEIRIDDVRNALRQFIESLCDYRGRVIATRSFYYHLFPSSSLGAGEEKAHIPLDTEKKVVSKAAQRLQEKFNQEIKDRLKAKKERKKEWEKGIEKMRNTPVL